MKKVWISLIITLGILLFSITNVKAVSSIQANISSKDEKVNGGQEVIITLKFEQYIDIDKGINAYKAKLEYDSEVFEKVKESDFIGLNDWEEVRYNENNGEFIAIKKAGSKLPEDVMQITLKVKQDAKPGKKDITIKEIAYSEGEEDILAEDISKSIEVIKDSSDNPEDPDKQDKPDTPSNPENPDKQDKPGTPSNPEDPDKQDKPGTPNNPEDPDKQDKPDTSNNLGSTNIGIDRLPNTGSTFTVLYILIAIEILIATISYIKYKKVKKAEQKISKKTQMFMTMLGIIVISSQLIGTTYAAIAKFLQKGDIDLNDEINIYDIRILEEHLIGLNILTDKDQLENAEISGDGKITITDLTLLVRKVEKATEYQVALEDIKIEGDNYYLAKNQEFVLSFSAKINQDAYIQAITINNKEYSINDGTLERQNETNNIYKVKLNSGDIAGTKKYNLTKVLLNTGKEVKLNKYNYTIAVNVLKQEPSIKNYKVVEENEKAYISFDLVDEDNSISKSQIIISHIKEDKTEEVVKTEKLTKGSQTIKVKTEAGKNYQVKIEVQYNLAPGTDKEQEYKKELKEIKTFKAALDYRFTISNIKTVKDEQETNTFSINEPIQIVFESINSSDYEPESMKVNGKLYPVIKKGGKYRATIDGVEEAGEKTITIEAVILSNGKEFIIEKDNTINLVINKRAPKVTELNTKENVIDKSIKISFNIEDYDNTIQNAQIILYDSEGNIIIGSPKEITSEELKNGTIEKFLPTSKTDKYIVKIVATYKIKEEETVENAVLIEREIEPAIFVDIKDTNLSETYVEKGENVNITYKIETNSKQEISKIRVNSIAYNAKKIADNEYSVTVPVGNEAKLLSVNTTEIILEDGTSVPVKNEQQVDVLKDVPKIENIIQEDDINSNKVTLSFKVVDTDEAIIKKEENELIQVKLIKSINNKEESEEVINPTEISIEENGEARAVFENLKGGIEYVASFTATYSRYHNTQEELQETGVIATANIDIVFVNIKEAKIDKSCAEKGEEVKLSYNIESNSKAEVAKIYVNGVDYEAIKTSDGDYTITVPVGSEAKLLSLKATEIQLKNDIKIIVENEQQVDVLKDNPRIEEIRQEDDINSGKVTVTFKVVDTDGAIIKTEGTSAVRVQIVKLSDNEEIVNHVETTIDENGNGRIVLEELEEGTMYAARFIASYNRYNNDSEQLQENQVIATDNIELIRDYKLQVSNIKTSDQEGEKTNFEKDEPILLSFESTNATEFKPKVVKVNGTEYELTEKNNKYIATLEGIQEAGEKTITIESVILSNGKEFVLEKDNDINIVINKTKPTITHFETEESVAESNIKINFNIEDADKTIQTAKIELYDSKGNIIGTPAEITSEELASGTIEKLLPTSKTDKYKVKVIATYKLSEENIEENSAIFEQEVEAEIFANITEMTLSKNYAEKGERVDITYGIETNSKERITKVVVNGTDHQVTKESDGRYIASVPVGDEAKLLSLKTTKLFFSNGIEITVDNEVQVDVLKEAPKLEQIKQVNNSDSNIVTVTFKVVDPDGALIKPEENALVRVQIAKASKPGEVINTMNASVEENGDARIDIENLEIEKIYVLKFIVSYNRYHNASEKLEENKIIGAENVELIKDNEVRVVNIRTCNNEGATKYFKKNEDLIIELECLNNTTSQITHLIFSINGDGQKRAERLTRVENTNIYRLTLPSKQRNFVNIRSKKY